MGPPPPCKTSRCADYETDTPAATDVTFDLPFHLRTAHVVGAIDSQGRAVHLEKMQDISCAISPARNGTLDRGKSGEDFAIRIFARDGVVDLSGAEHWFSLAGREVDAYECL